MGSESRLEGLFDFAVTFFCIFGNVLGYLFSMERAVKIKPIAPM